METRITVSEAEILGDIWKGSFIKFLTRMFLRNEVHQFLLSLSLAPGLLPSEIFHFFSLFEVPLHKKILPTKINKYNNIEKKFY